MNDADNTEAAATPPGKPLSLRQARGIVIAWRVGVILVAALGIHELLVGEKWLALAGCSVATLWLLPLSIQVYIYLLVKKGKNIVFRLAPLPFHKFPQVPLFVSAFFAGLLTLLVAAVSYDSLSFFYRIHKIKTLTLLLVTGGMNLFLWLVVVFVWYCLIVSESRKPKQAEAVLEQTENVWPPAPQFPVSRDKNARGTDTEL